MMMRQGKRLPEMLPAYEIALAECGLGYATRLRFLQRETTIILKHEQQGKEHLNHEIAADFFRETAERLYSGDITKKHYWLLRREITRFLHFVETGEVKLPNPRCGARQALTPEYERIAESYLTEIDMHPNTRGDARWVTHKYFAWLDEHGYPELHSVGAEHLQKFLLDCSLKMSMNSIHDVKLHLSKLYAYLYKSGLSESSYQALLSFKVNRESKMRPVMSRDEIAKMLCGIDRKTVGGKRAYAVILLGAVLGLRACDVANLKRSDIDWLSGEIKILQQKTAETVVLPLTRDIGEALKGYILNARPRTDAKHIFVRMLAPHDPLKSAVTIGEIFRDCCKTVNLDYSPKFISGQSHNNRADEPGWRYCAMSEFVSGFASKLDAMFDYRVACGYKRKTHIARVLKFDKFCADNFPGEAKLTREIVHAWVDSETITPRGLSNAAGAIRQFGKYLNALDEEAYILPDKFAPSKTVSSPYLFTDNELTMLFAEIDRLPQINTEPFFHEMAPVLFRLIYTCGLRPNEGRELLTENVNLVTGEILITNTKRNKERIVVMSDDMLSLCR